MDFEKFRNSTCILDKSGIQAISSLADEIFQPYIFLKNNNIDLAIPSSSFSEFTFQDHANCSATLFTGPIVRDIVSYTGGPLSSNNFVLSDLNGTITLASLDPTGVPLAILPQVSTLSLGDTSSFMVNPKNYVDCHTIRSARVIEEERDVFILTDDNGIIGQCELEGIKYLKPIQFLKWMVQDRSLTSQKAVSVFGKWRDRNWTHGIYSFKSII